MADMASVLTSSGHGGRFSFGLQPRDQAAASGAVHRSRLWTPHSGSASRIDAGDQLSADGRRLRLGVMTVATTSVREDMAVALVEAFGSLLRPNPAGGRSAVHEAADGLRDRAGARTGAVTGCTWCWERRSSASTFRGYAAACLGLDLDQPGARLHPASFGVGELGLHLCTRRRRRSRASRGMD